MLIACLQCGNRVSDEAAFCPRCGRATAGAPLATAPRPKQKSATKWVVGGALLFGIGVIALAGPDAMTPSLKRDLAAAAGPNGNLTSDRAPAAESRRRLLGAWLVRPLKSEMTGHEGLMVWVKSLDRAEGWLQTTRPELRIQCWENRTSIFFDVEYPLSPESGDGSTVYLRLDQKPRERQVWREGNATGTYFASNSIGLARRLVNADTLRVQFTPHNASSVVVRFPLHGLRLHLTELSRRCGWKL